MMNRGRCMKLSRIAARTCFLLLGTTLVCLACACAPKVVPVAETMPSPAPDWFTTLPVDSAVLYAAATATSQDRQMAIDKATLVARAELARRIETKVQDLTEQFETEVGLREDQELFSAFTRATKSAASSTLVGSRLSRQEVMRESGVYRSYVLMELPLAKLQSAVAKQIETDRRMYPRLRTTEAFKELEEQARRYEEGKQGPNR